jgi:hypothetical protein
MKNVLKKATCGVLCGMATAVWGSIFRWTGTNVALFSALKMGAMSSSKLKVLIYKNASCHTQLSYKTVDKYELNLTVLDPKLHALRPLHWTHCRHSSIRNKTQFSFLVLQVMNENDETDEEAIEMSVEELQKLTNDHLNGSLQVRHKGLQLLMFAETHHMACTICNTEYSSCNEKFHRCAWLSVGCRRE